jgi:hypothetical protein
VRAFLVLFCSSRVVLFLFVVFFCLAMAKMMVS